MSKMRPSGGYRDTCSFQTATSSQTELRLLNVARSSLEELLLDYEDFLRHRRIRQWRPDCPEALAVRQVPRKFKADSPNSPDTSDLTDQERWTLYAPWLEHADPAVRANALICLINQANFLLDQQIASLETRFIEEGGYSEQLATARRNPEKMPESNSGAAAPIPTAKALLLFDGSLNAAEPSLPVTVCHILVGRIPAGESRLLSGKSEKLSEHTVAAKKR